MPTRLRCGPWGLGAWLAATQDQAATGAEPVRPSEVQDGAALRPVPRYIRQRKRGPRQTLAHNSRKAEAPQVSASGWVETPRSPPTQQAVLSRTEE